MAYNRKYYENNKDMLYQKSRAWQKANQDKVYARQREHYHSNGRFLDAIKLTVGCMDCGYNLNAVALDFDHVNGDKGKYSPSQMKAYTKRRLIEEVMTCDVVCANCHRVRTHIERKEGAASFEKGHTAMGHTPTQYDPSDVNGDTLFKKVKNNLQSCE